MDADTFDPKLHVIGVPFDGSPESRRTPAIAAELVLVVPRGVGEKQPEAA